MLNGHSQGGMIASSLAANEDFSSQFNVTNVMTYGSPVDNYDVPSDVNQLNIQHRWDLVPKIDFEGSMGPVVPGPHGIPLPCRTPENCSRTITSAPGTPPPSPWTARAGIR